MTEKADFKVESKTKIYDWKTDDGVLSLYDFKTYQQRRPFKTALVKCFLNFQI